MPKYASMACALMWPLLVLLLHDDVGSWPLLIIGAALLAWRCRKPATWQPLRRSCWSPWAGWGTRNSACGAYPVAVNAVMLAIFLSSLWRGMPVIERLARLREPELPAAGVRYTRNVTWAWCGFFILNGAIASWTALYASLATWTLYNGAISYGLIAVMFTGEWLVRHQLRSRLT